MSKLYLKHVWTTVQTVMGPVDVCANCNMQFDMSMLSQDCLTLVKLAEAACKIGFNESLLNRSQADRDYEAALADALDKVR